MVGRTLTDKMNERNQENAKAAEQIREASLKEEEKKKEQAEKKKAEKEKENKAAKKTRKQPEGFQISLYLPNDLVKKADEIAVLFKGGRSELIKKAVQDYIAKNYEEYKKIIENLPK